MVTLKKIWLAISGKKTYILGTCLVIVGIYGKNWEMVTAGLTLITGRSALASEIESIIETIENKSLNAPADSGSTATKQ